MAKALVPSRHGCLASLLWAEFLAILLVLVGSVFLFRPSLAAKSSDLLRAVIGDKPVAQLESDVFQVKDAVLKWRGARAGVTPSAPWPTSTSSVPPHANTGPVLIPNTGGKEEIPTPQPSATLLLSPTPAWMPQPVSLIAAAGGEGLWSAYIQNPTGQTLAYRTFVLPDPARPYTVVGIVAFDGVRTRLHYVLGWYEPHSPTGPRRTGLMPSEDRSPGTLLAMFNGGFKARHGQFGAMADGVVALPARDDLATLAIYRDGRLALGEWGNDLRDSPDLLAWRQNGPMLVHAGQIDPSVEDASPAAWGDTIRQSTPTWRSGIGLSADGKTFYYVCGSSLTVEMLAKAMLAAGIQNGMQLDINNYWVHFVAVRDQGDTRSLEPLFPSVMFEDVNRYLLASPRDYFYVTLAR